MDATEFKTQLLSLAEKNGCEALFTEERTALFCRLTEHMLKVNETFNLTAIKDPARIALLHYIDSVKGAHTIPEGASVIDVGCGAGFPSLPLAICRPDLKILAVDSTAKRVRYVEETAKMLGLSHLSTMTARAEELGKHPDFREKFDCATARAVAALPVLSELCLPFVKLGGIFAAMKGKSAKEELSSAKAAIGILGGRLHALEDTPLYDLPGERYDHATIIIQKEKRTPDAYPRLYTKIVKAPL